MPLHTNLDSGAFMEDTDRVASNPAVYGRGPGKILAGHNAPDALIVDHLPPGDWVYAEDLAVSLFALGPRPARLSGKYLSRLYTLAKRGYLESVVLYPNLKRYYRILDIEKCRAEVAIRYLTGKYNHA